MSIHIINLNSQNVVINFSIQHFVKKVFVNYVLSTLFISICWVYIEAVIIA